MFELKTNNFELKVTEPTLAEQLQGQLIALLGWGHKPEPAVAVLPEPRRIEPADISTSYPKEWETIAEGFIKKHVQFRMTDVTDTKNYFMRSQFRKWLEAHPQIEVSRDDNLKGKPYIFIPFYMKGTRKVLATPPDPREACLV